MDDSPPTVCVEVGNTGTGNEQCAKQESSKETETTPKSQEIRTHLESTAPQKRKPRGLGEKLCSVRAVLRT